MTFSLTGTNRWLQRAMLTQFIKCNSGRHDMMCQRTRGTLEEATKLGSERPVSGDSPREGAGKGSDEEGGGDRLQGPRTYRAWL